MVPVGDVTLGRILNVVGEPVDEGEALATSETRAIHNAGPRLRRAGDQLAEILVTGIKVIDLLAPIPKGGKIGLFGARCGQDGSDHGTDQQHRQGALRAFRCSRRG